MSASASRTSVFAAHPWLYLHFLALMLALAGCGKREYYREELFPPATPYSAKVQGSGDAVCWSVKHAFLTQGYMLDRSAESLVMSGTKESQPDDETNVTL